VAEESLNNFGIVIAYVIPGLVGVYGISMVWPPARLALEPLALGSGTLGGFLHLTLACVGAGLTASTVRWLLLDTLHHHTGLTGPVWNLSELGPRVEAFELFIQIHYRYYQFYGNSLVSLTFTYFTWRATISLATHAIGWPELVYGLLAALFFAGSRDTLRKYYARVSGLLGKAKDSQSRIVMVDD